MLEGFQYAWLTENVSATSYDGFDRWREADRAVEVISVFNHGTQFPQQIGILGNICKCQKLLNQAVLHPKRHMIEKKSSTN